MQEDIERARLMLRVAAQYILANAAEGNIFYDEADCDGYCVAEDCEIAANDLPEDESE